VLAGTVRAVRDEPMQATLTLPQAAQMVVAWSLVHGFAMLLLDDRLKQLVARLPPGVDEMAFLPEILGAGPFVRRWRQRAFHRREHHEAQKWPRRQQGAA
jgi:hypothetical protein